VAVLVFDLLAVAVGVALFWGARWGMVLLLTCDYVVLAVDVICHIIKHFAAGPVLQEVHHQQQQHSSSKCAQQQQRMAAVTSETSRIPDDDDDETTFINDDDNNVGRLDQRMEGLEQQQQQQQMRRCLYIQDIMDTTAFVLQLFNHWIIMGHLIYIWYLYGGIQITLVDGVLALLLQSALISVAHLIAKHDTLSIIASLGAWMTDMGA